MAGSEAGRGIPEGKTRGSRAGGPNPSPAGVGPLDSGSFRNSEDDRPRSNLRGGECPGVSPSDRAAQHLVQNPAYAVFSLAEASQFLKGGQPRSFSVSEVLITEGDPGDSLIVITAGKVNVLRSGVLLATLGAGDTLGEMALVDPAPRSATVVAASSGTLIEVDRTTFSSQLAASDPVAVKALQGMSTTVFERLTSVNNLVRDEVLRPRGNVFSRLWGNITARLGKG